MRYARELVALFMREFGAPLAVMLAVGLVGFLLLFGTIAVFKSTALGLAVMVVFDLAALNLIANRLP